MKRSKQIQLVLITAALASCNRVILPRQSMAANCTVDSTLTATPSNDEDPCSDGYSPDCQEAYAQLWNYSFGPWGAYPTLPYGSIYYYPGGVYGKGAFWRNNHFVVRGGWGKIGGAAGS